MYVIDTLQPLVIRGITGARTKAGRNGVPEQGPGRLGVTRASIQPEGLAQLDPANGRPSARASAASGQITATLQGGRRTGKWWAPRTTVGR